MVNRKAVDTLPDALRPLFSANVEYLAEHAIDPDLWRFAGRPGEDPQHYLDLDAFGAYPFDAIPEDEAEHRRRNGADATAKGRVPWRVAEAYRALVDAFRGGRPASVLEQAAILGHYVGDAHVPLHAVLNYDGQLSDQKGVHGRWEAELVERYERQIEPLVEPGRASRIEDPVAFTFGVLRQSFQEASGVLAADRELRGAADVAGTPEDERYDDAYYSKLYEREAPRLLARLAASAQALGSMWWSAWQDAGRPALDGAFRMPYVRGRTRAVLLSLDGSSAPVLDDAVRRGVMPNLARLRRRGATARGSLTSLPVKTSPGHAALFTGTWSDRNGIAGNSLPRPGGSILEHVSGYRSDALRAEPIWVTAARQGLPATVVIGTQVYPFAPYLEEKRFGANYGRSLTLFDGYQNSESGDALLTEADLPLSEPAGWSVAPAAERGARETAFEVEGVKLFGLLFDDPADPARGFDTLLLRRDKGGPEGAALKPSPARLDASAFGRLVLPIRAGQAAVFLRLFELSPDASRLRLYRTGARVLRSNRAAVEAFALSESGGFVGGPAQDRYDSGQFGPTLAEGGDGTAEARYLETVALTVQQYQRLTDFGLERTSWKVLVTYLPFPDGLLHLWLGRLDASLSGHDPALAARLRPHLDRGLGLVDGFIGHLAERLGDKTLLAIGGDHGLVGTNRVARPNVALREAGLLRLDAAGEVDLSGTQAMYFVGDMGYVVLNRVARPGGILRPEDEAGVMRRAISALRAMRDARARPLVLDVLDARRGPGPHGIGGPNGGDLYLSLAPGVYLSSDVTGALVTDQAPEGIHLTDPERPGLHASFTVSGPGVARAADLGLIRQIDVAPTLCALLGLEPPAQATGSVLPAALAHPLPGSTPPVAPPAR